jgi:hypothetical protein
MSSARECPDLGATTGANIRRPAYLVRRSASVQLEGAHAVCMRRTGVRA